MNIHNISITKSLKLKLSKTLLVCLGGGILLLILVFLAVTRVQQISRQKQLADEMTQVNSRLTGLELGELVTQKEQVQEKVDSANSALQHNMDAMAQYVTSITGEETLFSLATSYNVTINDISSSPSNDSALGDIPCTVFPIEAKVDGELTDLVNFVTQLKNNFGNSMVESVNISPATTDSPAVTTETNTTTTTSTDDLTDISTAPTTSSDSFEVDINLTVYIYKGS